MDASASLKVVLIICVIWMSAGQNSDTRIEYNIVEELPPGTPIGNVGIDAQLGDIYGPSVLPQLRYSFLSQPNNNEELFDIEETTGILKTNVRIDRDSICLGLSVCMKRLDIAIGPGQYFRIIPIQVEILDTNDNPPRFSQTQVSTSISESALPGTSISLPIPEDPDSPRNGIVRYDIIPPIMLFDLQEEVGLDGSIDLQLVLKGSLDREQTDSYQVRVVAYDGGDPVRSGSVIVDVVVEDANDNHPKFTNSSYVVTIPENLNPQATIITVEAEDADITHNGEIIYGFTTSTNANYGELFGIVPETGDIYLKSVLDAETNDVYHIVVTAKDKGIGSRPTQAMVTVRVQDMNDNTPQIMVNTLYPDGQGHVSEVAAMDTFVAHVSVIDKDAGQNGLVYCFINDTNFAISKMHDSQYKIVTSNVFDREEKETYVILVSCEDHGSPPLRSNYNLTVQVTDVNDQIPEFNQTVYTARIQENNVVDAYVIRVTATDKDVGINADIRYSLIQNHPHYFRIMPQTGVIRAALSLDFEEIQTMEFKVVATDLGNPQQSSTATVSVLIEDRNDEPPTFIQESYSFGIFENQEIGSEVGIVTAYDPDSEPFREVGYDLYSEDGFVLSAFEIDSKTGRITTKLRLDRESIPVYHLTVRAFNPGFDLSSSATVTVYVADDNDHAPIIDFPSSANDSVSISNNVPFGYVVTRIRAHDLDIGNNAQLMFAFIKGNEEGLFDMDHTTGAITVTTSLDDITYKIYNLSVEVMDSGEEPLTAITIIHITVDGGIPYNGAIIPGDRPVEDDSGNNSFIVIIVGCVSGGIIVALIVAILAIRIQDQRRKQQRRYNCRTEAQKMLRGSPNHLEAQPTPLEKVNANGTTPNIYNPSSKYTVAGPDIMNSTAHPGDNNIHLGPNPEGCSRTSSFVEAGSLNRGKTRGSWSKQQDDTQNIKKDVLNMTNTGPSSVSHGSHRATPTFHSFSIPHTEVGHHPGYHTEPYRHSDHQGSAPSHGFPAHSAALSKSHLSPLAEDIQIFHSSTQMQQVPWVSMPCKVDHDAESACSGEVSNTDSGRGASEEGEHNHHGHNQPGNRLSDISDSDLQEKINKVGCHGSTMERHFTRGDDQSQSNKTKRDKSRQKPSLKQVPDVPSKKYPHKKAPLANTQVDSVEMETNNSSREAIPSEGSYRAPALPVRGVRPGVVSGPLIRKQPPCPPRSDSLRKDNPYYTPSSLNESQYSSTAEIFDDSSSSTTSGSYVVDQDDISLDDFTTTRIDHVTLQASNV